MTNITKTINSFLKENIPGLVIHNDLFPDTDTIGLVSVHDPAPRIENRFIDGSAVYQINISYNARYENAADARSKLDSVLTLLDGRKLQDSIDGLELKITANANVQFIGIDDKNRSIYTCSISVEYKTNNF